MRVLQICNKIPFPPQDGGCIAMNNLAQGLLNEGCSVKVLAVNTTKHFVDVTTLPSEYRGKTGIESVFIDTAVKPLGALLNLFSNDSYNITRFYSVDLEKKLIEILSKNEYDVVLLESLFVSMYADTIRKYSKAKIVLRAHNVEHQLWERNAHVADNLFERIYFKFLAKRLKKYEEESLSSYDAVAAITSSDLDWFKRNQFKGEVKLIPFGIDLSQIVDSSENSEANTLFHIGAMDWQPNIEGLNWFLKNVWGEVHEKFPQLKLYLAGRKMSHEFKRLSLKNVVVIGEVENAHQFIQSKGLMIVPLLSGGGMRVKIIEGMALSKVIVTTSVGSEGIEVESGKNILIANDKNDFVEAISLYMKDEKKLTSIGENAKKIVFEHYNNTDICKKLVLLFKEVVG